jgi:hypothetical protein
MSDLSIFFIVCGSVISIWWIGMFLNDAYSDSQKRKAIEKQGYPPAWCNALGYPRKKKQSDSKSSSE